MSNTEGVVATKGSVVATKGSVIATKGSVTAIILGNEAINRERLPDYLQS